MLYNAIKGRFTRVAPDKTLLYGAKQYTFSLTTEQSKQLDYAVYAVVLSNHQRKVSFSIDEKLALPEAEFSQHKPIVRLRLRQNHTSDNKKAW
ncbi:hypothetical protein [Leuconostoc citreum]